MSDSHACPHQTVCSTRPSHFHDVAAFSGLSALRAVTVNHRNVGLGTLSQHAAGCDRAMALHEVLTARGIESFVLATCNRTELYWRARQPGDVEAAQAAFRHAVGSPEGAATLDGRAAAHHLFRVSAGLESLVLGEAEILGQVRAALAACTGAGAFLHGVVRAALRAGRLARAETAIGVGALSVVSAAVQVLAEALPLGQGRVLVIGAGDTGTKAARHLRALGVSRIVVANRTLGRAETVAANVGADAVGLDAIDAELVRADAVLCAVDVPVPLLGLDALDRLMAARRQRPLIVVDLGMPPAIEPGAVPGVTRVDLASVEQQVADQRDRRAAEVPKVERVLDRELGHLQTWARHHAMRPLVSDLRQKVEAIRRAELARAQRELPSGHAVDVAVLDRLSRRLLEQVLALPLRTIEAGEAPLDPAQAQYLRRLFALESEAST